MRAKISAEGADSMKKEVKSWTETEYYRSRTMILEDKNDVWVGAWKRCFFISKPLVSIICCLEILVFFDQPDVGLISQVRSLNMKIA